MDYVAYYRVSTKRQSSSGLGLDAQKRTVNTFVEKSGKILEEFVETESGAKNNRRELTAALAFARKHRAALLIAKLDRFSRRLSFIASMMESGVPLIVAEMPNATDFQLHIFAALAQEERRLIATRTKAALAEAKRRGQKLGINGQALAERNHAEALQFARTLEPHIRLFSNTTQYSKIAEYLNKIGIKTRSKSIFYPQTVKNYITLMKRYNIIS